MHSACSLITKNIDNFINTLHVDFETNSTPNVLHPMFLCILMHTRNYSKGICTAKNDKSTYRSSLQTLLQCYTIMYFVYYKL